MCASSRSSQHLLTSSTSGKEDVCLRGSQAELACYYKYRASLFHDYSAPTKRTMSPLPPPPLSTRPRLVESVVIRNSSHGQTLLSYPLKGSWLPGSDHSFYRVHVARTGVSQEGGSQQTRRYVEDRCTAERPSPYYYKLTTSMHAHGNNDTSWDITHN